MNLSLVIDKFKKINKTYKRECYCCGTKLSLLATAIANTDIEPSHLIKIWKSKVIKLICCSCSLTNKSFDDLLKMKKRITIKCNECNKHFGLTETGVIYYDNDGSGSYEIYCIKCHNYLDESGNIIPF